MTDLIKMDIYRLVHSKSFKVGLLFSIIIPLLVISAMGTVIRLSETEIQDMSMNIIIKMWIGKGFSIGQMIMIGLESLSLLVSTVLTVLFVNEEQSDGFIKNIAGIVPNRGMLVVSKFCGIAVINLSIFLVYTIVSVIAGAVCMSSVLIKGPVLYTIFVWLVKFLLYMAIDSIILCICMLTKSRSLAIGVSVIWGIGVIRIVYSAIGAFINMAIRGLHIDVSLFTPDGVNAILTLKSEPDVLIRGVIISLIYSAVFMLMTSVILNRRDVK
ncbi:MAG: ABC transporter permease [Frisingicoccus sp.]|uniref:ABC transporter permease n=1 Tax=Frisingicoccus sp. TaxID=1918627 RepID=UPI002A7FEE87|nr:ABC transporter permease [Frisingicoccus sp.]MDY4835489.1 ABC transporter permease [Frisingicoccus sp.]